MTLRHFYLRRLKVRSKDGKVLLSQNHRCVTLLALRTGVSGTVKGRGEGGEEDRTQTGGPRTWSRSTVD